MHMPESWCLVILVPDAALSACTAQLALYLTDPDWLVQQVLLVSARVCSTLLDNIHCMKAPLLFFKLAAIVSARRGYLPVPLVITSKAISCMPCRPST